MKTKRLKFTLLSICSVSAALAIWYVCTAVLELVPSKTLPDPIKVLSTFIDKLTNKNPDGGTLLEHLFSSLKIALAGYGLGVVIGIPLGIIMAWYKKIDQLVRPIFDLLKPIPGVAWVPLMIVLLGVGFMSKATVIFIAAIVPCVLNAYAGVKQTKDVHLWVARSFGATNFQMLMRIAVPSALPFVMTGIRVALGQSWLTIVAAELLASTKGLGFMIQQSRGIFRTDIIIVGMLTIGMAGAFLSIVLTLIEKIVVKGRSA